MIFTVSIVSGENENETIVVKLPMNEGDLAKAVAPDSIDFTDDELKLFDILVAKGYSYDAAFIIVRNKKYKIYRNVPTYEDVAEECVRSLGGIENLSISTLMEYFDWDRYGRDLCVINSIYEIEDSADRVEVLDGTTGRL